MNTGMFTTKSDWNLRKTEILKEKCDSWQLIKNTENNKYAVPNAQNGFIIKQTVDRITIYDKYMQIKFKCGVTFARQYVE